MRTTGVFGLLTDSQRPFGAPVIVTGTGPVGVRFVQELHRRQPERPILVFGDEPWLPYNRVKLSSLLSGDSNLQSLYDSNQLPESSGITPYYNNRIKHINPKTKQVMDSDNQCFSYSDLVLAVGSLPRMPSIPGTGLKNVFTFRNLSDVEQLMSRSAKTRRCLVIGGGLLGLEAARGMQRLNTQVTVIEHSRYLMFYQLDQKAADYLETHINDLGIETKTGIYVKQLNGSTQVESATLSDGTELPCDTVVFATGITPNTDLARRSGLSVGQGIRVNDRLQTSRENIHAIGECAEHRGMIYGLVSPGYEQAAVLAYNLSGGRSVYEGSIAATSLKVAGMPVFSAGSNGEDEKLMTQISFEDKSKKVYRKLILNRGLLEGAIQIGDSLLQNRLQEAVTHNRRIWPWQNMQFRATGSPWPEDTIADVAAWPADAIVCNCMGVSRGKLDEVCASLSERGACNVQALATETGASTVCGTCKPLLQQLSGSESRSPIERRKILVGASLAAVLGILITFLSPANTWTDSLEAGMSWDFLWRDNLIKQYTGYTLLGITVLISAISLRKRIKQFDWGKFMYWRLLHAIVGALLIVVLFLHTGLRVGDNLNLLLMLSFCGLILSGAISGWFMSDEHKFSAGNAIRLRRTLTLTHIVFLWPLPVLLGYHIVKSYYF